MVTTGVSAGNLTVGCYMIYNIKKKKEVREMLPETQKPMYNNKNAGSKTVVSQKQKFKLWDEGYKLMCNYTYTRNILPV